MPDLKAAVIGCGGRARDHARGYREIDGARLAAVCDVDRERADRFAVEYEAKAYYDAEEMLAAVRPEVVSIVTQAKDRAALALLCAKAGVRGICAEKPMALTMAEAHAMVEECQARGVVLTVSHQMRYDPAFEIAQQAISRGEIGEPYFLRGVCYGNLMEQGTHLVDMLLWLAGDPEIEWVMAQAADFEGVAGSAHPAPMWTVGYLAFRNGMRATLEAGRRLRGVPSATIPWYNKRVEVLGTDGMSDSVVAGYCRILSGKAAGWQEHATGVAGWNAATGRFLADLCRVVAEGGEHRNHARISLRSFEAIQALAASVVNGGIVHLPLPRDADPLGELARYGG
ncbi:MAG: Gfo/Idh/MocA family oxidoreductase [Armatimonadetes bacterium]|nr:Gfo/Idh/MocA family oxidoreductase [Armatimonadota bacterium]